MKFNTVLSKMSDPLVSFVSSGSGVIKRGSGQFVKTGNPLDVAVKGDGWLSVGTPSGQAYTRDGRMRMNAAGDLVSMTGARILDAGGGPIQLDPTAGQAEIGADGTITQGGKRVDSGLFTLPANAQLSRVRGQCLHVKCSRNPNCGLRRERRRTRLHRAIEREHHDGDDSSDLRSESLRWRQRHTAATPKAASRTPSRRLEPDLICGCQTSDA